jgi:ABC-type uncharacterized transport system involved in gliding motility auxiliary subunit
MRGLQKIIGPLGLVLVLIGGVTYGILYTSGWIAFLPLFAGLVLTVTSILLQARQTRTEGSRRSARLDLNAGVSIVFLAAIMIFLQTLSARHFTRLDTTSNRRFSLSEQSVSIVRNLYRDIVFTCFFKETTPAKKELLDLLVEYRNINNRITYRFIDPDKDPVAARRYDIKSYGTIVVESGELEDKLHEISESKITNSILKVTRSEKKKVYFVTGHGERSLEDSDAEGLAKLKSAITEENYDVEEILTLREDELPEDCDILFIAGAEKDLFIPEREIVSRYLERGGALLVLLEPILDLPELHGIVARYGVEIGDNVIIDRFGKVLAGNFLTPVVNQYGEHPITEGFKYASFFPQARSVVPSESPPEGIEVEVLASTGESAYAESNIDMILEEGRTQFEGESDLKGPVGLAAIATGTSGKLVVFGDADFVSNAYLELGGNKDLIMNTVSFLAEEKDLIAIRPKDPVNQPVILTSRQGRAVFWLPVIGMPLLVGTAGIAVSIRKRRSG